MAVRVKQVGGHVDRWQPSGDRRYPARNVKTSHEISWQRNLMPVLSARASYLATGAMASINAGGPVHPGDISWHKVESLMCSVEEGGKDPELTQPVSEMRKGRPCNRITIAQVLRTEAAPVACVRLQLTNPAMQRERQRMCSR